MIYDAINLWQEESFFPFVDVSQKRFKKGLIYWGWRSLSFECLVVFQPSAISVTYSAINRCWIPHMEILLLGGCLAIVEHHKHQSWPGSSCYLGEIRCFSGADGIAGSSLPASHILLSWNMGPADSLRVFPWMFWRKSKRSLWDSG